MRLINVLCLQRKTKMGVSVENKPCGCKSVCDTYEGIQTVEEHCNKHDPKHTTWVETDEEPDDIMALAVIDQPDYFVVGEGDSSIKFNRINEYAKLLGNKKPVLIKGESSDKPFHADGKEFDKLGHYEPTEDYFQNLKKFATGYKPVMFSIKPMRELLALFKKDQKTITDLVKNIELFCYGSFNFITLFTDKKWNVYDDDKQHLVTLLNSFKKVNIYETFFATGADNSINKEKFPKLYNLFQEKKDEPFYQALIRLVTNWNQHIRDECQKDIDDAKSKGKEPSPVDINIINNISGNEDFQFVLADFALAAVHKDIEPVKVKNLRFEFNPYAKRIVTAFDDCTDDEVSNVYVYKSLDKEQIEDLLVKYLK